MLSSVVLCCANRRCNVKTIDKLWYCSISPFEQCTRGVKRLKELLKLATRNCEEKG